MILFKVSFQKNIAVSAAASFLHKPLEWKENPYTIISMQVYANNNVKAMEIAQSKADILLKKNK
ncbi:MAG: hypothetical protein ABIU63_08575 [Chitinophagaceae bacterium]